MNLATWSIRNPAPAILLFLALTFLGLHSFVNLPIQNFPDISLPTVTVTASLPGATPSMLETEVTKKIEDSVATLTDIDHISSTISQGVSTTTVVFNLGKDPDQATNDVRNAVSQIQGQLPQGMQPPVVTKVTVMGRALSTYAVSSSTLNVSELSWLVDNDISKTLLQVPGVANVVRQGGVSREILVELDPLKLQALGVTAAQVSSQLAAATNETPAGQVLGKTVQRSVEIDSTVQNLPELLHTRIVLPGGNAVQLDDIARIRDTSAPSQQSALLQGRPVVSFQVFREAGYGDVQVYHDVQRALTTFSRQHPQAKLKLVSTTETNVQRQYTASMHALYEGAVLAVFVVFIFLRDWRATVVSAVALPLSIIPTFYAMHLFGFSLNTLTLLALTLVVGILVDDAIVEVENIVRHSHMGKSRVQAASDAATEIATAVIATTLTLVAVFLPTAFMDGIPGLFFKPFGWTVALAVLGSLLVARTLTPMLASRFMLEHASTRERRSWVHDRYLQLLQACLCHPGRTLLATLAFLVASGYIAHSIPVSFFPPSNQDSTMVTIQTPAGSTLAQTQAVAERARKALKGLSEISGVYTSVGSSSTAGSSVTATGDVTSATLNVDFVSPHKLTQQQIEAQIRTRLKNVPGALFTIGTGSSGESLQIVLASDNAQSLEAATLKLEQQIRALPGIGNVTSTASSLRPELSVRVNSFKAATLGVTPNAIAQTLRIATAGDFDASLAKLNLPTRQVPIVVRLPASFDEDPQQLAALQVPAQSGTVPLGAVAHIEQANGASVINRYDRNRSETITVQLGGKPLGVVMTRIDALPAMKHLPSDVFPLQSGELKRMHDLFSSFGMAMVTGVLCVYAVLVLLFHDFSQPLTILAALPLSAGGAFGALLLFGYSFSMSSLIGLLMLMGIVTKNSILLVEYAVKARREHGFSRTQALLDSASKRVRPILMTTVAMTAGMLPIALGLEGDTSFRGPMAVTVIGGLWTSTLLSLLVVPVLYEVVDELKARLLRTSPPKNSAN